MISAKIIADSKNEFGNRLTTFVLTFPRIVLAEFNTHRMFSRNSASSRAIPFKKMVKMVKEDPFIPIKWMKEHSGMQGNEFIEGEIAEKALQYGWLIARDRAVEQAGILSMQGLTKQICNRLLEPFMWHTVIVTASEWENFFALRSHEAAEIHIQELAHKMLEAYNESEPKFLKAGEWHIPFGDQMYDMRTTEDFKSRDDYWKWKQDFAVKIATARCARVSYMNFEGDTNFKKDLDLHDRLLSSGHMSPFEHCARAMSVEEMDGFTITYPPEKEGYAIVPQRKYGWCGNFRGFIQYRKMIEGENKSDNRVKK